MTGLNTRYDYLDGLRGWAALSVVVFHATGETFAPALPAIRAEFLGPLNDGKFAVPLFFVLSGFVLSQRYIATGNRAALQRMAAGRYVRLALPVGMISCIGYVMAVWGLSWARPASAVTGSAWLANTMTFAVEPGIVSFLKFCVFNVFTTRTAMPYNPFTWTMMYELCGSYMLFATLALFGDQPWSRRLFLLAMCSVTMYFNPFYGMFFCGALLAEVNVVRAARGAASSPPAILGNMVGLALVALVWAMSAFARAQFASAPILAIAATLLSPWVQTALETPLSRWLGRVSFPLYLVHGYVIFGPGAWAIVTLDRYGFSVGQIAAVVVPGVIGLSLAASWILLPVERLAKRVARQVGELLVDGGPSRSGPAASR